MAQLMQETNAAAQQAYVNQPVMAQQPVYAGQAGAGQYGSYMQTRGGAGQVGQYGGYQYSPEKAYNTLLEARMLLTAGSGIVLERNNTPLLYTPIDELTDKFKDYGGKWFKHMQEICRCTMTCWM